MAYQVIGFFDTDAQAQAAAAELTRTGIAASHIDTFNTNAGSSGQSFVDKIKNIGQPNSDYFAEGVRRGGTLLNVTVDTEAQVAPIEDVFGRNDATDVELLGSYLKSTGFSGYDVNAAPYTPAQADTERLQLREERLNVSKNRVQTGEVVLRKVVVSEIKTIDVPVTHEEVIIERHAVSGVAASNADFTEETIRVPVMDEQVVVDKNAFVTEEVSLGKREVTETQRVTDTVRREEARVENADNVDVLNRGTGAIGSEVDADEIDTVSTTGTTR